MSDSVEQPAASSATPEQTSVPEATPAAPRYGWASIAIAAFFGVFFAYDLWEAVSTLLELPTFYRAFGFDVDQLPWWVLIVMVALPVVGFGVSLWVGRRRSLVERALIFLVGLAVVAGLTLGLIALETILRPALLSGIAG
jgi:hypothetical protein